MLPTFPQLFVIALRWAKEKRRGFMFCFCFLDAQVFLGEIKGYQRFDLFPQRKISVEKFYQVNWLVTFFKM